MGATEIIGGPAPVTTARSSSTAQFVPLTAPIDGRIAEKARVHFELQHSSGDLQVKPKYQTSSDGVSWTTVALTSHSSFISAAGWTYSTTFDTLNEASKVRFGVEVKNTTNAGQDCATVKIVVELTHNA